MSRLEVKFSGFGGQGIGLMGRLVGEAISRYENGKNSIMTQSYGPESRGGASSSDIVIDEKEIDYPLATELDYLVSMSEEAYDKYIPKLKEGGILFLEENLVRLDDRAKKARQIHKIPATKIAETLGNKIFANIVMLGFICANSKLFSEDSIIQTLKAKIKPAYVEKNLIAFEKGKNHTKEVKK